MKQAINSIFLIICLLFAQSSRANHIIGGDLLYTHLTGNDYRLTLTLYGDCATKSTSGSVFNLLFTSAPSVNIYNGSTFVGRTNLRLKSGSGIDVSPVCPRESANTTCNGGTLTGVYQFIYEDTITLPSASAKWSFVFNSTLSNSLAGRSTAITNVNGSPISFIQLSATLDNTAGANSSPQYATVPTVNYCNNALQQYNQSATDADGDSLVFTLVPAIDSGTGSSVNYISPYTATAPMATAPGNFAFSALTGQMSFTPNSAQIALIVVRVMEYRGGKLVGSSERELCFVVRNDCTSTPPSPYVSAISGAASDSANTFSLCKGTPEISFTISMANPSGDSILLSPSDIPSGATVTLLANNTASPTMQFRWPTGALALGTYTFRLGIKGFACPIVNNQTVAYTIKVTEAPTIAAEQLSLTGCTRPAAMRYILNSGFSPRRVKITQGTTVIKILVDTSNSDTLAYVFDSLAAGNYVATVSSDSFCSNSVAFTIRDSGEFSFSPATFSACLGDPSFQLTQPPLLPGATVQWYDLTGAPLASPPVMNTNFAVTATWYVKQTYKSCTSALEAVIAVVHPLPEVRITSLPSVVCYGDQIYLTARGAAEYRWQPIEKVKYDTNGYYVNVLLPTSVAVTGKDTFGCSGSDSTVFADIQRCCNFSFPTAFTPNNDGVNDGWKVLTYGNMQTFELNIYNRWGQLMFSSSDARSRWDGTYLGQPCEVGAYFYYMNAQCLTGPKKFYKGDFVLIR